MREEDPNLAMYIDKNVSFQAAKGGSLSACVITAAWLDTLGFREEAMRYHKRAAKLGDPMSQVTC